MTTPMTQLILQDGVVKKLNAYNMQSKDYSKIWDYKYSFVYCPFKDEIIDTAPKNMVAQMIAIGAGFASEDTDQDKINEKNLLSKKKIQYLARRK